MPKLSVSTPFSRVRRATLVASLLVAVALGAPALAQRRPVAPRTTTEATPLTTVQRRAAALNPGVTTQVTRMEPSMQEQLPTIQPAPRASATLPTTAELAARLGVGTTAFEWSRSIGHRSGLVHDMPGGTRIRARPAGDHFLEPNAPGSHDLALVFYDLRDTVGGLKGDAHAGFVFTIERAQPNHGYAFTCTAYLGPGGVEAGFIDYSDGITQMTTGIQEPRALTYVWENRSASAQPHQLGFILAGRRGQASGRNALGGHGSLEGCVVHSYAL